jgi:O-antigen/teichoic acid export membrane protein
VQPKIISNTISLIISKLIPAALLTLINILYSRGLNHSDYGIYQTVWSFVNVCVIITTFGIPRYIMTFGNIYSYSKIEVGKILLLTFILTLLPVSAYLFFYYQYVDFTSKALLIAMLISQSLYLIQEANTISLLNNRMLVTSNILYAALLFAAHVIILYYTGYSLNYCLWAIVIISALRNILVWQLSTSYRKQFNSITTKNIFNTAELFWFGLNDSLQVVTKWFDKLLLLLLLPPAQYAIYFNGTYEIPLIGIALVSFQSIITSVSAQTPDNEEKQLKLFNTASLYMSGILFPLFAFAFIYSNEIINLLFGNSYNQSAILFAISALLLPMRICSYTVLLQLKQKGKIIVAGSVIDFAAAVALMIILYPLFSLPGIVLAVVIATYIQAGFYLYQICKLYVIQISELLPLRKLLFRFTTSVAGVLSIRLLIGTENNFYSFLLAGILTCLLVLYYSDVPKLLKKERTE